MFNFLSDIVNAVKNVVSYGRKVDITTLILDIISYIPKILTSINTILNDTKDGLTPDEIKKYIDAGLDEWDNLTGIDGMSVIPGMPIDIQEETLDALKIVIRNLAYQKAKVKGYYKE